MKKVSFIFTVLFMVFSLSRLFSQSSSSLYNLNTHFIDITELPDIHLRLSVNIGDSYYNTLSENSFEFRIDNSKLSVKSFRKGVPPGQKFYTLFIFDESFNMKGGPVASSKRICESILGYMSSDDMTAFVGLNRDGMRIVDFTSNKQSIISAIEGINPSGPLNFDMNNEILRRINIFENQIFDKELRGAVFIFSNILNFDYNLSYDISQKYPFVYIFNFSTSDTHISQITSDNFFLNPPFNLDLRDRINRLLQHRPCYYDFTLKSNICFNNGTNTHRFSIATDIIQYDTFNFIFKNTEDTEIVRIDNILNVFYLNRFLMYLSLLTLLNLFIFMILRLLKDLRSRHQKRKFYLKFLYGQIIMLALSFVISFLY